MGRILLIAWMLLGGAAVLGAPLPIEHFTRFDEFGTLKISPDGGHVAMSTTTNGRSAIVFIDLRNRKLPGGVRARDSLQIHDFHWVSNTRLVYSIMERGPKRTQPGHTGELFAINTDGTRHEQIYGFRGGGIQSGKPLKVHRSSNADVKLISALPDDDAHILIAEYPWREGANSWRSDPDARPRVVRLNVFSGEKETLGVVPLRSAEILIDHDDQVRFAVGWDSEFKLAVAWKPDAGGEWQEFNLAGFREEGVRPLNFSADNKSVLLTGVREGESLAALYHLDLQSRALQKVHAFAGAEMSSSITDFAGRETIGVRADADRPIYHWLVENDPAAVVYRALQRAFQGHNVEVTSTTDDGRLAIVFVSSDVNPGDYYLFDTKTMKADFLRAGRAWIEPRLMRPMQPVRIAAREGVELHGYLTKPAGDGPHSLVVLPHGGPHAERDVWAFNAEVQLLANRGYAVLQVNYRGSAGYGMDFQEAGYRQWGARMQDDITDATRWAIEQKIAPSDRVCIFGKDYGGYAALMGAVRGAQLYRCAIGYGGFYDLELMFTSAELPDSRMGLAYLRKTLGSDPADLQTRSPVHNAQHVLAAVMLIHGKADWWADFEHAARMKAALENHKKPLEWLALKHEGHEAYDEETRREVYERILAFLDKHLMAGTSVPAQ